MLKNVIISLASLVLLMAAPLQAQTPEIPVRIKGRTIFQDSNQYLNPGSPLLLDETKNAVYILSSYPGSVVMRRIFLGSEQMDTKTLERFEWSTTPSGYISAAISPDGRYLAYSRLGSSGISLVNLDTLETQILPSGAPPTDPLFSFRAAVDGLAFDFHGNLYFTVPMSSNQPIGSRLHYLDTQSKSVTALDILFRWGNIKSSHGGTVLWGPTYSPTQTSNNWDRYDISGATPIAIEPSLFDSSSRPEISDRSSRLLTSRRTLNPFGGSSQQLVLMNASSLNEIARGPEVSPWIFSFALNPQGDTVYQPGMLLNQPGDTTATQPGILSFKLTTDFAGQNVLRSDIQFEAPSGTVNGLVISSDGAKLLALVDSYNPAITPWQTPPSSTVSIVLYDTQVAPICDLTSFKMNNDALRAENALLTSQREKLSIDLNAANEKVGLLESKNAELQASLDAEKAKVAQLQAENDSLKAQVSSLTQKVKGLITQLQAVTAYYVNVINKLQVQLYECQKKALMCMSPTPTPTPDPTR